jgi:hypothetical protein
MACLIKYKEIGEKFIIDGDILECVVSDSEVSSDDCKDCYFNGSWITCKHLIQCADYEREDGKDVWFKLVSVS